MGREPDCHSCHQRRMLVLVWPLDTGTRKAANIEWCSQCPLMIWRYYAILDDALKNKKNARKRPFTNPVCAQLQSSQSAIT